MKIKLTAPTNTYDGYGYITENLALALTSLGHEVEINPIKIWENNSSLKKEAQQLIRPIKPDFELIIMYPTYDFGLINKRAAIMTMYEATKCPNVWTEKLNQLRLPIITPSQFVRDMFKNSGVKVPITVCNLGINTEFYAPIKREFPEDRPFRFLTVGKMEPRKNADVMVKCFQRAFSNEKVELIIKTREKFTPDFVRKMARKDDRIRVIEKTISEIELRELLYYADAFIYFSRGEAFSFPPRNAVATGLPTLVTDWSALSEILGAIKVPIKGLSPMYPCGFSYGQEKELLMADIDEAKAAQEMFNLATNKEYYEKTVKNVSVTKQMTWEECAENLIKIAER